MIYIFNCCQDEDLLHVMFEINQGRFQLKVLESFRWNLGEPYLVIKLANTLVEDDAN